MCSNLIVSRAGRGSDLSCWKNMLSGKIKIQIFFQNALGSDFLFAYFLGTAQAEVSGESSRLFCTASIAFSIHKLRAQKGLFRSPTGRVSSNFRPRFRRGPSEGAFRLTRFVQSFLSTSAIHDTTHCHKSDFYKNHAIFGSETRHN